MPESAPGVTGRSTPSFPDVHDGACEAYVSRSAADVGASSSWQVLNGFCVTGCYRWRNSSRIVSVTLII